jgi:hypothetical protein
MNFKLPSRLNPVSLFMANAGFVLTCATGLLVPWADSFCSETAELPSRDEPREAISYDRDIRPIFSDTCFKCHGPDESSRKENLRFDLPESAFAEREGGYFAIVPGDPEASEAWLLINEEFPEYRMPPPESHLKLTEAQIALIGRWIEEGAKYEKHWAFEIPSKSPLPKVKNQSWPITEVDRFVLARLEDKGIEPAPEAEPTTWLRRVTQDLTGLPPTLEEIEAFAADDSPEAERRVVDRLLNSVDYAERMTAIWLDNARYGDSNGFQQDNVRTMWPWRDWVIEAFRANMPYDQFITEQLAGDLLKDPTQQQLIATGFNRNHPYSIEGGIIDEEYRVMYANDKTTTFGTLFLGLTMECTRCHDHKYDPLTMTDYYSLFAFFNASAELGAPGEKGFKHTAKAAPPFITYQSGDSEGEGTLVMIMEDTVRESYVLEQGQFDRHGEKVEPRTPEVLPDFGGYSGNRLGLARWLTSSDNPLFARVTVNRLWQQFFGIGLVDTPDNFGMQGALPTHPILLDWLAVEFRHNDWDLHHLIRTIVLSATYRQSPDFRPELEDPKNRLLARGPTFRLPAEMIRDQALIVSGLMTREVGGPSVMPYQPDGVWGDLNASDKVAEIYEQDSGPELFRKSMYTYWRRAVLHPAMAAFDAPSRDVCIVGREVTNTPLQALVTLHGPTFIEAARNLAENSINKADPISQVFRTILSRSPDDEELEMLQELHEIRSAHYVEDPDAAARLLAVGESPVDPSLDPGQLAALADVCHVVLNLSETITRK